MHLSLVFNVASLVLVDSIDSLWPGLESLSHHLDVDLLDLTRDRTLQQRNSVYALLC